MAISKSTEALDWNKSGWPQFFLSTSFRPLSQVNFGTPSLRYRKAVCLSNDGALSGLAAERAIAGVNR